jgi:hypothetical protein
MSLFSRARRRLLPALLVACVLGGATTVHAQAAAPAPRAFETRTTWSSADEAWFERNRRFATAGKVLSVVGRVAQLLVLSTGDRMDSPYWSVMGVAGVGELMWSGSELRATNELRRRGYELRRGAAVAAVVGAVVFAPMTWIAGPIQSSRIRDLHDEIVPYDYRGARPKLDPGAGLTLRF